MAALRYSKVDWHVCCVKGNPIMRKWVKIIKCSSQALEIKIPLIFSIWELILNDNLCITSYKERPTVSYEDVKLLYGICCCWCNSGLFTFFFSQIFMLSLQTLLHSIMYLLNKVTKGESLDTSMKCKDRNVMSKHQSVAYINKGSFSSSLFESRTYSHYLCVELLHPALVTLATLIHTESTSAWKPSSFVL